jgi:ATP-dependent 26S proteasome regulatory subunit
VDERVAQVVIRSYDLVLAGLKPKTTADTQILDVDSEEQDGGATNEHSTKKTKCATIKTSTRQTVFLPMIGLVPHDKLIPGDLIGVNKDSYLILDKLPSGECIT